MPTPQLRQVMPSFILIKIPKQAQRERLEKIGSLFYPPEHVFMKRGMQCGEIVQIGSAASKYFPEARVGHILIFHHIVEGKETLSKQKFFFIDQDENWNYYLVTGMEHNGDRNMTFGVWDGEGIIPNKDYIFLKIPHKEESDMPDFDLASPGLPRLVTNMAFRQAGHGIVVPKAKKENRGELSAKMEKNLVEIKKLSRWLQFPDMLQKVTPMIKILESENEKISKAINTTVIETHTVAFCNSELNSSPGSTVYILNIACYMEVEFMKKDYIIAESKYINAIPNKERVS